jgi:hypothetical protein
LWLNQVDKISLGREPIPDFRLRDTLLNVLLHAAAVVCNFDYKFSHLLELRVEAKP